ncbi:MAG: HIT family protein [Kiritimatiellia bacterium]|jgi:histidine triad (HIT) family protein
MTDPGCIFCKIAAGQAPSCRVYEDDHCFAFLDLAPFEEGHTLVIPKVHAPTLLDLPDDVLPHLLPAVRAVARMLKERLRCDGFNVMQSNGACATQVVPHVHFHVIPRWNDHPAKWAPGSYAEPDGMRKVHARLVG